MVDRSASPATQTRWCSRSNATRSCASATTSVSEGLAAAWRSGNVAGEVFFDKQGQSVASLGEHIERGALLIIRNRHVIRLLALQLAGTPVMDRDRVQVAPDDAP